MSTFRCRWGFCTESFDDEDKFATHHHFAHILTAKKIKRKDVVEFLHAQRVISAAASQISARKSGQFASYNARSSPIHTPPFLSLPSSPTTGEMVLNAIEASSSRIRKRSTSPSKAKKRITSEETGLPHSRRSPSTSNSSQEIEQQLTQTLEEPESPPMKALGPQFRSRIARIMQPPSSPETTRRNPENGSTSQSNSHVVFEAPSRETKRRDLNFSQPGSRDRYRQEEQSLQLQTQAPYFSQSSTDGSQ